MNRRSLARTEPRVAAAPREEGLSVGALMGRARASFLSALDTELEQFGLNSMQFAVLKHLSDGAANTAADLCRLMHHDTGAMTRLLDRLEAKGLVRRERGRADRRVVLLRVAGRAARCCRGCGHSLPRSSRRTWQASARPRSGHSRTTSDG